jgi:hypothetical protein
MAKVKIEEIVDHLSSEMRSALRAALNEVAPTAHVDEHAFYQHSDELSAENAEFGSVYQTDMWKWND